MGEMVDFPANGHLASGYLALPESGSGPGLVLLQEWWGLVDHIRDLADRFAAAGFVTLAPDLYHGETAKSPDEAGKLFMALNIQKTAADLRGAADFLRFHDAVTSSRVGVIGFCMGGQLALYAGCEHPDRYSAVVDFYGIHPKVEPKLERLDAPLLAHFGRLDKSIPVERVREMEERLRELGKPVEIHWYDAGHAFFNDQRPAVYSEKDAALAWERTVAFLKTHVTEG